MTLPLTLTRRLSLSPPDCFALWADPAALAAWWGPKDASGAPFAADVVRWSLVEGAEWRIRMTAPSGEETLQGGEMLEIRAPHLIRFSFHWIIAGRRGPAMEIAVRFEAAEGGTLLHFEQTGLPDEPSRESHRVGWTECLDRLADRAERAAFLAGRASDDG